MPDTRLTAVIADDERLAREKLRRALQTMTSPGVTIVREATNGSEALDAIESLKPDFAVLDIQMPGISGLDVARNLSTPTKIIFATAFDKFAVRAFEVNAVDYVLKPYDPDRMHNAVSKLMAHHPRSIDDRIRNIVRATLKSESLSFLERIPQRLGQRIKLIDVGEIVWFDTSHSTTFAHMKGSQFDIRYSLDELEQRLDPGRFIRTHRASIVNVDYIAEILPWFNGQLKLKLKGLNAEVHVSRSRVPAFKGRFDIS